ncbi:MAG: rhomboid family intramembrane serine protease, partial [Saprospiraceae bacterium]
MNSITDTVKHIIIINVLMFFGTNFLLGEGGAYVENNIFDIGRNALALFYPTSTFFRPHQLITHMFMHADLGHLFFNMFAVYMFGSALESYWGMKRFL